MGRCWKKTNELMRLVWSDSFVEEAVTEATNFLRVYSTFLPFRLFECFAKAICERIITCALETASLTNPGNRMRDDSYHVKWSLKQDFSKIEVSALLASPH